MSTYPRVSILLPAFQAASTIAACLRSLSRQTFSDWECIVLDDGSTDGTGRIVAAAAALDPRLRVQALPHRGLVATLNAGLGYCRGTYIARMDADDLMHRNRLMRQVAYLEAHAQIAGCGTHVRIFPRAHLKLGWRQYETWLRQVRDADDVQRELFVECPAVHPSLLFRSQVLRQLAYRETPWPEDYDLLLRLHAAGHRLGMVPERLLAWRDSPQRLTRTDARYGVETFARCKAHYLARGFLAAGSGYLLWGYGSTGRRLRQALAAEGARPHRIIDLHPGRLGNRVDGAPVIAPSELGPPGLPLIVSVAYSEPRRNIRRFLAERGYVEGRDFVCAA